MGYERKIENGQVSYKQRKTKKTPDDVAFENLHGQLATLSSEQFNAKVSLIDVY